MAARPAFGMTVEQGEQAGRGRVNPVEPANCPAPGLVEVDDRRLVEQNGAWRRGTGRCASAASVTIWARAPTETGAAEHVGEQLSHPVKGQVLMDRQVGGQRSDRRSVTGGGGGRGRERLPWSCSHSDTDDVRQRVR